MDARALPVLASLVLLAGPAVAQVGAQQENTPDANRAALVEALTALSKEKQVVFTGRASRSEPEQDAGGGAQVVISTGGDGADEFVGAIEVFRTEKEELLIASKKAVPGFGIYDNGNRTLVSKLVEDTAIGTGSIQADLAALFDFQKLLKAAGAMKKVEKNIDAASGATLLKGRIGLRPERAAGGPAMAFLAPKVLRVDAEVTLDAKQVVQAIKLSVVRSDPTSRLRKRALEGGGGVARLTPEDLEADETDEQDGVTSAYELKRSTSEPSARMKRLLSDLREAAGDGK